MMGFVSDPLVTVTGEIVEDVPEGSVVTVETVWVV
jgi:hypothetical protein